MAPTWAGPGLLLQNVPDSYSGMLLLFHQTTDLRMNGPILADFLYLCSEGYRKRSKRIVLSIL